MNGIPHASLVKEVTAPEVYLVVGDQQQCKLHIRNTNEFQALGFSSDKVQTVPDGTLAGLPRFEMGPKAATKPSDVFFEHLTPDPSNTDGGHNCKEITAVVAHNVLIAGWINASLSWNPGNGEGYEDVHYGDLLLDVAFINRVYGPDGLSTLLNTVNLPGSPQDQGVVLLTVAAGPPRGVTANSFSLSGSFDQPSYLDYLRLHLELNAWHVNDHTGEVKVRLDGTGGIHRYTGRGPAPAGWMSMPVGETDPGPYNLPSEYFANYDDQWFQEDPRFPSNDNSRPLAAGDYVVMWGTLWQDSPHNTDNWATVIGGMGGYLELHPIDWIGRVPAPHVRTIGFIASAAPSPGDNRAFTWQTQCPFPDLTNARSSNLSTLPDHRFTSDVGVVHDSTRDTGSGLAIDVTLDDPVESFKTTYVQTWFSAGAPLQLAVGPQPIALDVAVTLTVDAINNTGARVNGAPVLTDDGTPLGVTDTPFTHTFKSIVKWTTITGADGRPHRVGVRSAPTVSLTVNSPDYAPSSIQLHFIPPSDAP